MSKIDPELWILVHGGWEGLTDWLPPREQWGLLLDLVDAASGLLPPMALAALEKLRRMAPSLDVVGEMEDDQRSRLLRTLRDALGELDQERPPFAVRFFRHALQDVARHPGFQEPGFGSGGITPRQPVYSRESVFSEQDVQDVLDKELALWTRKGRSGGTLRVQRWHEVTGHGHTQWINVRVTGEHERKRLPRSIGGTPDGPKWVAEWEGEAEIAGRPQTVVFSAWSARQFEVPTMNYLPMWWNPEDGGLDAGDRERIMDRVLQYVGRWIRSQSDA